jgi:hypothetical protein
MKGINLTGKKRRFSEAFDEDFAKNFQMITIMLRKRI